MPAVEIFLVPNVQLLDRHGKDLLQNPVVQGGVMFLAPRLSLSIDLHEDIVLERLLDEASMIVPGDPSPPERSLRVTCRAGYQAAITGRRDSDAFTVDLAVHLYGWTISTISREKQPEIHIAHNVVYLVVLSCFRW